MSNPVSYFQAVVTLGATTVNIGSQLASFKQGLSYPFVCYMSHRSGAQGEYVIATADDGTANVTVSRGQYGTLATTFAVNDGIQQSATPVIATWIQGASYQATPANPTATTNTTGVMMGLAGAITPLRSGVIEITISGDVGNASNTGTDSGAAVQIRYGTGAAPANAAALTGTAVGGKVQSKLGGVVVATNYTDPFSLNAIVSGLSIGTAYWIDISLAAISNGTATASDISISISEL